MASLMLEKSEDLVIIQKYKNIQILFESLKTSNLLMSPLEAIEWFFVRSQKSSQKTFKGFLQALATPQMILLANSRKTWDNVSNDTQKT